MRIIDEAKKGDLALVYRLEGFDAVIAKLKRGFGAIICDSRIGRISLEEAAKKAKESAAEVLAKAKAEKSYDVDDFFESAVSKGRKKV